MKAEILIKDIAPEWRAKETEKSNLLIRAWILEAEGDTETALRLYAQAAQMEEQIAAYSKSIGLDMKSWYDAISAAGCWAKAGDLYRALQGYETLLQDPTLHPTTRSHVCNLADKLREQWRQWSVFRRQQENEEENNGTETNRQAEVSTGSVREGVATSSV